MDIRRFKERFDPLFIGYLTARIETALGRASYPGIRELLSHTLTLAGEGKRLRPYLAYLGEGSLKETLEGDLLLTCIGIELFHTFALVHDDIIDKDAERRGVPTLHAHAALAHKDEHTANSLAMLMGDLLLTWAREALAMPAIQTLVETMSDEVNIGQTIDVMLSLTEKVSTEDLDTMVELKTARYSFARPLQIGATLRGATQEELDFFFVFGRALGSAFQIQDDSFDQESDRARHLPSYFTRGPADLALARMNERFEEAKGLLDHSLLAPAVTQVLRDFSEVIRSRTR